MNKINIKLSEIINADTENLVELAQISTNNPDNFFVGSNLDGVDICKQNVCGLSFRDCIFSGLIFDQYTCTDCPYLIAYIIFNIDYYYDEGEYEYDILINFIKIVLKIVKKYDILYIEGNILFFLIKLEKLEFPDVAPIEIITQFDLKSITDVGMRIMVFISKLPFEIDCSYSITFDKDTIVIKKDSGNRLVQTEFGKLNINVIDKLVKPSNIINFDMSSKTKKLFDVWHNELKTAEKNIVFDSKSFRGTNENQSLDPYYITKVIKTLFGNVYSHIIQNENINLDELDIVIVEKNEDN